MNAPMTPEQRKAITVQIGDVQPATDALLGTFAESVANVRNHEHPSWEDLYCMNLTSYMGERMAPVLKRLLVAESEADQLRARVAELEAQRDRRRARLVALQNDALSMRGSLSPNGEASKVPFELGPTLTPAVDWLINRVAELEVALADATEPDVDGAGRTYQEYNPGSRDLRSGADAARRMIADRQTAEDPHDSPLHHGYALSRDLPEVDSYRSVPLPAPAALCATCGHNGAAHHHAGTACWADIPKRLGEAIRLCKCSAFVEVTR
ncbi:hypothetical protein ACWCTD_03505 [Streptomyces sp. NPDC001499]